MGKVVTRFPPSPTGYFHIGSARTALFNYLFAARNGGTMYLRFEDTDKARSKKEYEEDILAGLAWLKIPYTLPVPHRQSERTAFYKAAIQKLIAEDRAYLSKEPAKEDPSREVEVVRLRNPGSSITFSDLIRGEVTFDTAELKDFVIARAIDDPLYNFTVVVDDQEMGVTHVIRGEDHISNTARQILILEALGYERPAYVHIPLILAKDRSKMSKRHGAVSVTEYKRDGFLPEAFINYLALLGWNPGGEREIYGMDEIIAQFDLDHVQKGGAIFDIEKLKWFNREYLKRLDEQRLEEYFLPALEEAISPRTSWDIGIGKRLVPQLRERVATLAEMRLLAANGDFDYFFAPPALLAEPADKETAGRLRKLVELLEAVQDPDFMNGDSVKAAIWDYACSEGRKNVLQPMREILSGKKQSPDPFTIASVIGKKETISRLTNAIQALE